MQLQDFVVAELPSFLGISRRCPQTPSAEPVSLSAGSSTGVAPSTVVFLRKHDAFVATHIVFVYTLGVQKSSAFNSVRFYSLEIDEAKSRYNFWFGFRLAEYLLKVFRDTLMIYHHIFKDQCDQRIHRASQRCGETKSGLSSVLLLFL